MKQITLITLLLLAIVFSVQAYTYDSDIDPVDIINNPVMGVQNTYNLNTEVPTLTVYFQVDEYDFFMVIFDSSIKCPNNIFGFAYQKEGVQYGFLYDKEEDKYKKVFASNEVRM